MSGATGGISALSERLALLSVADRNLVLDRLTEPQRRALAEHWPLWAHDGQLAGRDDWRVWLIRAGRGFGKTRAGAEWVSAVARARPDARIALVGATMDDVRQVMVEGHSGLIAVVRGHESFVWLRGEGEFRFANGARAFAYSADVPDSLRGPEHHAAWADEIGKWRRGDAAWDNLMLGLRIGDRPQVLVTTTPRPTRLMRRVSIRPREPPRARAAMPAGSSRSHGARTISPMCWRMRASPGCRPRDGRARSRTARCGMARTGWSRSGTRAARWSRACCAAPTG